MGWPLITARVGARSVQASGVATDSGPSLDVGQSRPAASALARGCATVECGLSRPPPRFLGPGGRSSPSDNSGALARPVQLPTRGLAAGTRPVIRLWLPIAAAAPGAGPRRSVRVGAP